MTQSISRGMNANKRERESKRREEKKRNTKKYLEIATNCVRLLYIFQSVRFTVPHIRPFVPFRFCLFITPVSHLAVCYLRVFGVHVRNVRNVVMNERQLTETAIETIYMCFVCKIMWWRICCKCSSKHTN